AAWAGCRFAPGLEAFVSRIQSFGACRSCLAQYDATVRRGARSRPSTERSIERSLVRVAEALGHILDGNVGEPLPRQVEPRFVEQGTVSRAAAGESPLQSPPA